MRTMLPPIDDVGGIPEVSNTLFLSPPGPQRILVNVRMLGYELGAGRRAVYVTTDALPDEITAKATEQHINLAPHIGKNLLFIDCYSWMLEKKSSHIAVPGPTALNDLSLSLAQSLRTLESPRVIFQSISTLLLYNPQEIVFRFFQITGARLKAAGATTLWHCDAAMHDERTIATLKHLVDYSIETKFVNGRLLLIAPTIGVKEWAEVKI